ncbi:MAG: cobalt-precorrin 5A hydrolase [Methanobacteriaceae archaeon]|nr:cobalt-precorrin 5A hydrolase [Methanobacteriaceae archaeon]
MRFAIVSITNNSVTLAEKLYSKLSEDPTVIQVDRYVGNVKDTFRKIYDNYDCIIAIMATGIVVRTICNLIKGKEIDPAVLVIDDNGKHVISLLSGHLGGANDYTLKVAQALDANPVITTATDVSKRMGVDTLARKYWLSLNNLNTVKVLNRAISQGEKVDLYLPTRYDFVEEDKQAQSSYNFHYWDSNNIRVDFEEVSLILNPLPLVAGVGSRRGVSQEQVLSCLEDVSGLLKIPVDRLDVIATGEMKMDEEGIMEAAWSLGIPVEVVSIKDLELCSHPDLKPSRLVEKKFGVVGVAEPSALITAGDSSRLILSKTSKNGVSVAIAVSGRLYGKY